MIITWSIFITLSPLFFHNDLEDVNFIPSFMCKVRKWMEDALRIQKIIGHFMIFCQLQQFITLSIFGDFEWFKFQNVIQEIYFIPSFLVKSKFQVEGHVWMQNIIGHFWRKIWNISKYGKSTLFLQLWLHVTFSSSIHLIPFFFHCKACNLIFLKHQESCPKTPWVGNAMDLNLVVWNWILHKVRILKSIMWPLITSFPRVFASKYV